MKRHHITRDIIEIAILALLIFIVIRFSVQSYYVHDNSMNPGLTANDYIMVNKIAYHFQSPERGDVIVFHEPDDVTKNSIKRIIGLPGDHILLDSSNIWVNGQKLNEKAYVSQSYNSTGASLTVPANDYFVLGDNRTQSTDSRSWGFVPRSYIVGKASLVIWPLSGFHFINTYSDVYAGIPARA